jgi:hypothetical protein
MPRRYLLQRIEWVTTGWKGPCPDFKEKHDDMGDAESTRENSIENNLRKCEGCCESDAFKYWQWAFNPPKIAPSTLNPGDLILVISRNPQDQFYYCVGLGVIESYEKGRDGNNWWNELKCDKNKSVAFAYSDGHIKYPYGEQGYPKTGMACHTELKKGQLIELLKKQRRNTRKSIGTSLIRYRQLLI